MEKYIKTLITTELRRNIYKLLDEVSETGIPIEIKRGDVKLRIIALERQDSLAVCFIGGRSDCFYSSVILIFEMFIKNCSCVKKTNKKYFAIKPIKYFRLASLQILILIRDIVLTMKKLFIVLLLLASFAFAKDFKLTVLFNGEEVPFGVEEPATMDGNIISSDGKQVVRVYIAGANLELNTADWGRYDYAHIVATRFRRIADNKYSISATVRHNDQGWDHYADQFSIFNLGENMVQNGIRVLAHPHDGEQPFTRSQSNVIADGLVGVQAKDNVHGLGGSKIYLDLFYPVNKSLDEILIEYRLEPVQ